MKMICVMYSNDAKKKLSWPILRCYPTKLRLNSLMMMMGSTKRSLNLYNLFTAENQIYILQIRKKDVLHSLYLIFYSLGKTLQI